MRTHRTVYDLAIYIASKEKVSLDELFSDFKGSPNALSFWLGKLADAGIVEYDRLEKVYRFVKVNE